MTSRDRVTAVLNHGIPDRTPIDFGGTRGTGISAAAYFNLREAVDGVDSPPYMYDLVQHLVYPDRFMMDRFHVDVIDAGQAFIQPRADCTTWRLEDERETLIPDYFTLESGDDGCWYLMDPAGERRVAKKEKNAHYFNQVHWSYQNLNQIPSIIERKDLLCNLYGIPIHPWDLNLADPKQLKRLADGVQNLYETTDYAIALTVGCQILEMGQYIRGMDNFLCDLYLDESGVRRLLDALLEMYMARLRIIVDSIGPYLCTLRFVDDLGTQQAPLIDPGKYRELIKPYHRTMWDFVHSNSKCKVTLHSCGAVSDFIPDLLDAGLDILNPVQISASGMEPERLKREFGKDLVFWGGGCDTQSVLPRVSPADVREHVKCQINTLGSAGGMVFSQIHNIQPEVPAENIIAMLDSAYEFGSGL